MNPTEHQIEDILRAAPRPKPPLGLKAQIIGQTKLPAPAPRAEKALTRRATSGWLRRWWPALTAGALSVAGAAVLTVQRMDINQLKQSMQALTAAPTGAQGATPAPAATESQSPETSAETPEQEIARLKGVVNQLQADVALLEQTRAANEKLRTQLAKPAAPTFTTEELAAMNNAKARAENIQCVNHLKQLGLAVRVWAMDNTNLSPPDVRSMSNEVSSLKLLVCPGDHSRQPPTDWASVSPADSSYEYLAPSAAADQEPTRVLFRCPIHGNIGLCDGSVQSGVAKSHPERLMERDGKLYYQPDAPAPANPVPQPADGGAPNP